MPITLAASQVFVLTLVIKDGPAGDTQFFQGIGRTFSDAQTEIINEFLESPQGDGGEADAQVLLGLRELTEHALLVDPVLGYARVMLSMRIHDLA